MKAQHISSGIPLIIRSCKLYLQPLVYIHVWWPAVVKSEWELFPPRLDVTSRLWKVKVLQEGEYNGRFDLYQRISSKITESLEFLEGWLFLIRQISKSVAKSKVVFGEGLASRSPANWKSRPKIQYLMCPQEVTHYHSFVLYRSNIWWWKLQYNVAIFNLPWTTSPKPFWQNHVLTRHYALTVQKIRNDCFFPHKWIGTAGPEAWSTLSPLLTPLDCLWGHVKTVVCSSKPRHLNEGKVTITNSVHGISEQQVKNVFN